MMARSDLMTFWKFLTDVNFTGSPSKLTEDELRHMGRPGDLVTTAERQRIDAMLTITFN